MARIAAILACLALVIGPGRASAETPRKLALGTLAAHDFDPAFVALDQGFFAKHGLDVTITRIASVGNVPPALFSASVDIAPASPVALLQGADAGLDLVAVAGAARGRAGSADSSLLALSVSKIVRAEDLVGKKIGVNALNSFWNLMLKKWLVLHNISPDTVTWVEVTLPTMRDALKRRSVDAVAAVEPFRSSMLHDAETVNVADYPLEVNPTVVESLWMSTRDWALAHKPEVEGFRAAMSDANSFIAEHPTEAAAVIGKHWSVPTAANPTYFSRLEPGDLVFFVGMTKQFGVIENSADPATLILPN